MSVLTKRNAVVALNVIAAVPALIALGRQGAAAGRAIVAAVTGRRAA